MTNNSDGDLDAYVITFGGEPNEVWLNDGLASFTDSGQRLGDSYSVGIALGDVDRDGDLDAFVSNGETSHYAPNKVWLNATEIVFLPVIQQPQFCGYYRRISWGYRPSRESSVCNDQLKRGGTYSPACYRA